MTNPTLTRGTFVREMRSGALSVTEASADARLRGVNVAAADLDGDGRIAGDREAEALFRELDGFDRDGSSRSIVLADSSGATEVQSKLDAVAELAQIDSLRAIANAGPPVRGRGQRGERAAAAHAAHRHDGDNAHGHDHVAREQGGGNGGRAAPRRSGLNYDTRTYDITPPSSSSTRERLDQRLREQLPGGYELRGVAPGSEQERYLMNTLSQVAGRDRWGTETDITAPVDRCPVQGHHRQGRVTVTIDQSGRAVAELHGYGDARVARRFSSVADARAALVRDFGIDEVRNGSGRWTTQELGNVYEGFSRMSSREQEALRGLDLVREQSVATEDQPNRAAEFHMDTERGVEELRFGDRTFTGDNRSFVGDGTNSAPGSVQTIVHEAGHAVEAGAMRRTLAQYNGSVGEFNRRTDSMNEAVETGNGHVDAMNREIRSWNQDARRYSAAERRQMQSYQRAVGDTTSALSNLMGNRNPARTAALLEAAEQATQRRDAALGTLPADHPARSGTTGLVASQDALHSSARTYQERRAARSEAEGTMRTHQREYDATRTSGGRTRRLQNFVDFVQRNRITPFTAYAQENWPSHPEEFYAEAFSLYRTDPTYLRQNAPELHRWFEEGRHL